MKRLIIKIALFFTSILIILLFTPLAVVIKIVMSIIRRRLDTNWVMRLAISLDQLGNVIGDDLLNFVLIKRKTKSKFGDEDETVSSVIGKNKKAGTLTIFGKVLNKILNLFHKNHSIKSIEQ